MGKNFTEAEQQHRDALLKTLLKTPPQPRPKRERLKKKPIRTRSGHAKQKPAN
jgi:hypothetical protein